jgi:hypothetical protein
MRHDDLMLRLSAIENLVEEALSSASRLLERGSGDAARQDFEFAKRISAAIEPEVQKEVCWDWYCWVAMHRQLVQNRANYRAFRRLD